MQIDQAGGRARSYASGMLGAPQVALIAWSGLTVLTWSATDLRLLAPLYRSWSRRERLAYVVSGTAVVIGVTTASEVAGYDTGGLLVAAYVVGFHLVMRRGYLVTDRDPSWRERIVGLAIAGAFVAAFFGGKYLIAGHL